MSSDSPRISAASARVLWETAITREARATVRKVLKATTLPLIIYGPGQVDKDNEVLVAAAEEAEMFKALAMAPIAPEERER